MTKLQELQQQAREDYEKYFSANALDGGDIDHPGTTVSPAFAVDVTNDFLDEIVASTYLAALETIEEEVDKMRENGETDLRGLLYKLSSLKKI